MPKNNSIDSGAVSCKPVENNDKFKQTITLGEQEYDRCRRQPKKEY